MQQLVSRALAAVTWMMTVLAANGMADLTANASGPMADPAIWVRLEVQPDTGRPRHTPADVKFMQGMIAHHAQALVMADLVPARTRHEAIRLLARRIEVSQQDEIRLMRTWLEDRNEPVPGRTPIHAHHGTREDGSLMPGMLTAEELARLSVAKSAAFDSLFLESMIRHHEGALTMVAELFATPGAGQETEVFRFASDVEADQRAEIGRMRALLSRRP